MDAFRKLRGSVSKQQMAVTKHFYYGIGYDISDGGDVDEVEMHRQNQIDKLYKSARSGKEFQREIVKSAEAFTAVGSKNIEAGSKLSEDCCKYGAENIHDNVLAKAAGIYGDARKHVEKEQDDFNKLLSSEVLEPLRAMITNCHIEETRPITQRYTRMKHEAETQAAEVSRRQARAKESPTPENTAKLNASEAKMQELKKNTALLGKEATDAISIIDSQLQRLTFQRLVAMVEGEKCYHLRVAAILGDVEAEMGVEKQLKESAPPLIPGTNKTTFFLAEATHDFSAESDKELSLSKGDYVVVRKVSLTGWSEGESNGRAGWFPSSYVEKRHTLPSINNDPAAEEVWNAMNYALQTPTAIAYICIFFNSILFNVKADSFIH